MQLVLIALVGIVAAGVVSLFTPLAIKAGRALQWKTQPDMMRACQRDPDEPMISLMEELRRVQARDEERRRGKRKDAKAR
jgi:hypothetical protein